MNHTIEPLQAFNDNYIWLISKPQKKEVVCIDPGDASPVLTYLTKHQLSLSHILITHHHFDHIGGLSTLKSHYPTAETYGPLDSRIPHLDHIVKEGDIFDIDSIKLSARVIETPGHTKTHICFYLSEIDALFCGDTLFSAGCGRLFEGSAEEMTSSLNKLTQLPPQTKIFCAHEYTLNNLQFAHQIEPNNQLIIDALKVLKPNTLSLPSSLKKELKINPFLRCEQSVVMEKAREHDKEVKSQVDTFRVIRKLKDNF